MQTDYPNLETNEAVQLVANQGPGREAAQGEGKSSALCLLCDALHPAHAAREAKPYAARRYGPGPKYTHTHASAHVCVQVSRAASWTL